MTVTVELPDDKIAILTTQAASLGLTLERWLQQLAEQQAQPESIVDLQRTDPDEWARRFRAWAESHDPNLPVLSDEAMSRDSVYPDPV